MRTYVCHTENISTQLFQNVTARKSILYDVWINPKFIVLLSFIPLIIHFKFTRKIVLKVFIDFCTKLEIEYISW